MHQRNPALGPSLNLGEYRTAQYGMVYSIDDTHRHGCSKGQAHIRHHHRAG